MAYSLHQSHVYICLLVYYQCIQSVTIIIIIILIVIIMYTIFVIYCNHQACDIYNMLLFQCLVVGGWLGGGGVGGGGGGGVLQ